MKIDTKKIERLLFEDTYSIYQIAKTCGITSRNSLNNVRNQKNADNITLETAKKLQQFINKEEKKMLNANNIENLDYVWVFSELGDYLDEDRNFKNQDDFDWWKELADALAYLEEEKEINTKDLEINELEDYITIAEECGFQTKK